MKTVRRPPPPTHSLNRLLQREIVRPRRSDADPLEGETLAYEDVVALAARLMNKGYVEIGADFLTFANSTTGLAAFYRFQAATRDPRFTSSQAQDVLDAVPYVTAAALLLKSKTLERDEVAKAVVLIELGKGNARVLEDEPPLFMD